MSLSVMAAAVVLVVAAGIITGNLLRALEVGEAVEVLILVGAVVAAVLAAAVLVGALREVRAARAEVAETLAVLGQVQAEVAAVRVVLRGIITEVTATTRATPTATTPAKAAAITEPESNKRRSLYEDLREFKVTVNSPKLPPPDQPRSQDSPGMKVHFVTMRP